MSDDKSFYNQFVTLDADDFIEPFDVIEQYCKRDSLFNARIEIYEMFAAAMGSRDWKGDAPIDKANRMYSLKLIIQITEAVYLLDQLRTSGRLSYNIRLEK